ncbi:EAL domain-containing protein [Trabulsiella odontotermitis]|uniref:EAL domain-containing protein n=1 Tax=Trabulsiella odontotermitis TaxID=379893 RepID=UPI003AC1A6FC
MSLYTRYKKYRDKWWALPLFIPVLLLPVINIANTFASLDGRDVALYYLPLALMLSLMLFFGWAALPGMIIALWLHITRHMPPLESVGVIFNFLIPIILSWGGYRACVPRRYMVSHGTVRLMAQRVFWQMFFPATLFLVLFQFSVYLGLQTSRLEMEGVSPLSLRTIINYQALLVGCFTGVPLCYLLIRLIRHPRHIRSYVSQLRRQIDPKIRWPEGIVWWVALVALLLMLLRPMSDNSSIFSTNYTLSLLLPVMLWGSMRFGYRFMSLIWTPVLIVAIHFHYRYLPVYPGYSNQLAITSSSYLVFSFIVVYMAMLSTRQRLIHQRARRMAYLDPVVHMPNLRALSRALTTTPWSVLCFLRVPELEVLGRHYGVMMRIQYKQKIAEWLKDVLLADEDVYQLSGHDVVVRLNTEGYQRRIDELDARVKQFRFNWDGIPLQPPVGISYCYVRSPVTHLSLLLGELSTIADLSLSTSHPESLQRRGAMHLQQGLKDKVAMMNQIQQALERNLFRLFAQPIVGVRGDSYYEILLRMENADGQYIGPDAFLPVAQEFGLSSRIDLWVLEKALDFMNRNRVALPGLRFSLNITPSTACGAGFPDAVINLLGKYAIEPWQLIFELTERQPVPHPEQARQTMRYLQQMGCRVAIDDFGTGYASYTRLKDVDADMLKIDGSFIRNIVSSSLDYQIVASICQLARMKKMLVVAEFVENDEIRDAAISLGIDYLQGYGIGKPDRLEDLVASAQEQAEVA